MTRRINDLYVTEHDLTKVLTDRVNIKGTILEPCAGPGFMARSLEELTKGIVITNDIESKYCTDLLGDATDPWAMMFVELSYHWVISNPPFNQAELILPLCYDHATTGMAMLLRVTYVEPTVGRANWLRDNADQQVAIIPVNPRPRFRKGEVNPKTGKEYGTDSTTVAWFVWDKRHSWEQLGLMCPFQYAHKWQND